MAFELKNTVPWGRNIDEYRRMFSLSEDDLQGKILSFGDGPASFNSQMTALGNFVRSIDPVYQFTREELSQRIDETKAIVMEQMRQNKDNFVWHSIANPDELEAVRLSAMREFLNDFDAGKQAGRYINHEMPAKTPFADGTFDLGLSSHFLILYSQLGLDFHLQSIAEMLRVCQEVRIFPLVNLNSKRSEVADGIIEHFQQEFTVTEEPVAYEFQKGGNQMLRIRR